VVRPPNQRAGPQTLQPPPISVREPNAPLPTVLNGQVAEYAVMLGVILALLLTATRLVRFPFDRWEKGK
jgi:hypothetical protein